MEGSKPLVSIIIPIYNAEEHLYECLSSIKKQDFQNFELLLIDDGSVDKSKDIVNIFLNNDGRFHYFYQDNQGVSVARNYGLSVSNGDYIIFVDADDVCKPNFFKELVQLMEKKYDLVACGYKIFSNENEFREEKIPVLKGEISQVQCLNSIFVDKGVYSYPWNKIYRKEIIDKFNISFDKEILYGEDMLFLLTYIINSQSFFLTDSCEYEYRRHAKSITGNNTIESVSTRGTYLYALKKAEKILNANLPDEIKLLKIKYNDVGLTMYRSMYTMRFSNSERNILKKKIGENYKKIKKHLSIHEKMKYYISIYLTGFANFILKIK